MSITTTRALTALTSLLTAALIAGCSSDSPTGPSNSSSQTLDLNSLFSQMSIGSVSAIPGASAALLVPTAPAAPTIVPSACTYMAGSGSFTCPAVTAAGATFTISYYLYDASGHTESQPDPKTTAAVRTVTDASGTFSAPSSAISTGGTLTFTDHEDMTLSGLLTNTRTLNGTGKSQFDLAPSASGSGIVVNATDTTSNVVLPASGSASKWPQSGTITSDVSSPSLVNLSGGSGLFTLHSVITFNGTSTVKVTTGTGFGGTTCTIDLTGKTAPSCIAVP